jgi:hypothetical protein
MCSMDVGRGPQGLGGIQGGDHEESSISSDESDSKTAFLDSAKPLDRSTCEGKLSASTKGEVEVKGGAAAKKLCDFLKPMGALRRPAFLTMGVVMYGVGKLVAAGTFSLKATLGPPIAALLTLYTDIKEGAEWGAGEKKGASVLSAAGGFVGGFLGGLKATGKIIGTAFIACIFVGMMVASGEVGGSMGDGGGDGGGDLVFSDPSGISSAITGFAKESMATAFKGIGENGIDKPPL